MTSLFSYTIPVDDGAAPNPFSGHCTLAICKPAIRRTALEGDWIAGLGSINAPRDRNLSGHLVYAMRVDKILSLEEYDRLARAGKIDRIPNIKSAALQDRLGDCIYDYSGDAVAQRPSVHTSENIETDLKGENALLSKTFYYFGRDAIELPEHLMPIIHQTQGHKRGANKDYVEKFIKWICSGDYEVGQIGWPDFPIDWVKRGLCSPCAGRKDDGERDSEC